MHLQAESRIGFVFKKLCLDAFAMLGLSTKVKCRVNLLCVTRLLYNRSRQPPPYV